MQTPALISSWSTTFLAGAVLALLTVTGFYPALIPWNVSILIAGSFVLIQLYRGRWPFPKPDALMLLALGSSAIASSQFALGLTSCSFCTLTGLQFWAGSLVLLPLLWNGVAVRLQEPRFIGGFTLGAIVIFAAALGHGLHDLYYPPATEATPLWWPFIYRNHLVALVVLTLPLVLWNLLCRGVHKSLSAIAATLGIAGLLASGSRGGVALLACELLLFALLTFHRLPRQRQLWATTALLALLLAAIGLGGTAVLEHRLASGESLLDGRLDYWTASIRMIRERPWLGWSFGTWPDVYRQFLVYDNGLIANRAHSDWLEWTAEGGTLIAALLLYLLVRCAQTAIRFPWALGLPILLVYGMVDYTLRQPLVWTVFLILWLAATPAMPTRRKSAETLSVTGQGLSSGCTHALGSP